MGTITRLHGPKGNRKPARFYGCTRQRRGPGTCSNRNLVRHEILDAAVLLKLSAALRDRSALDAAVRDAAVAARAEATTEDRGPAIDREELAAVGDRIAHLVESIAHGGAIPELVARLKAEKGRQATLIAERERGAGGVAALDSVSWQRRLRARAGQLSRALARTLPETRHLLRDLLGMGTIALTPVGPRAYRFVGRIRLGGAVLAGATGETSRIVVSPTGFAGLWKQEFQGLIKIA